MRRTRSRSRTVAGVAGLTAAAAVALGGTAVAATGEGGLSERVGSIREALGGLVDDGTITEQQADEVAGTLGEELPERGDGWHYGGGWGHWGNGEGLAPAAEALGMSVDDLRTALEDGSSLAEVAEAQGVEVSVLVDAIVQQVQEHLAQGVEQGDISQEDADAWLANVREHAEDWVQRSPGDGWHGRGGWGWPRGDGSQDDSQDEEAPEGSSTTPSSFSRSA